MRMSKLIHVKQTERNQSLGMGGLTVQNGFFFQFVPPQCHFSTFLAISLREKNTEDRLSKFLFSITFEY